MVLLAEARASRPPEPASGIEYLNASGNWENILRKIRYQGFAALLYESGEISISVPVGAPAVAAIAISGSHVSRDFIPEITGRLRLAAEKISAALGGLIA